MKNFTQDNRTLRVETPLGKDNLLLQSFVGEESISNPFSYTLQMASESHDLPLESLLGQPATVAIRQTNGKDRFVNGIVREFRHTGTFVLDDSREASILSYYEATLVPWFWSLKLNRDCRIFQNLTVPEIVRKVFGDHASARYETRLIGQYARREYCVQYRESDFNFISRLLEEEGIFYFFEHKADSHKMILADNPAPFRASAFHPAINFVSLNGAVDEDAVISSWRAARNLRSDRFELNDFNFENPTLSLRTSLQVEKARGRAREIYDYPGEYESRDVGEQLVRVRFEEESARQLTITAETNGRGFAAGYRFRLSNHPRREYNKEYAVSGVRHEGSQAGGFRAGENADPFSYRCELTCFPHPTTFRPERKTEVPVIHGTQTAIVTGLPGEEIYVDHHGRVKVQFHWDRRGKRDDSSSCWIRVSQPWAGSGFGGITIPRIGQEVIVDFLEGDPDRPIITGRVYNGASRPPYELPANKAHSGMKSRSTPNGGSSNFNGIRMDDGMGEEKMQIQAEKDQEILVKSCKAETVGMNETIEIGVDRTEKVGNNQSVTVGVNDTLKVGADQNIDVGSNQTVKVGSNRNTNVGSNDVLTVGLTRTHTVGVNEAVSVGAAQEVSIGAVQIVTVGIAQINNIGLKQKTNAGKEISLEAPRIILKATQELTLKCGGGVITIDSGGNITIKGPLVKINT